MKDQAIRDAVEILEGGQKAITSDIVAHEAAGRYWLQHSVTISHAILHLMEQTDTYTL